MLVFIIDTLVSLLVFVLRHVSGFKAKLVSQLKQLRAGLSDEKETKDMLKTYAMFLSGEVGRAEMMVANRQLRDVMRTLGLGVLLVLPFSFQPFLSWLS